MHDYERRHMNCPHCLRSFSYPPERSGQAAKCPACKADIVLEGVLKRGQPKHSGTHVVKSASARSTGRALQWVGLLVLLFSPLLFWFVAVPIGIVLILFGGTLSRRMECGSCGTAVSRPDVQVCPGCRVHFIPAPIDEKAAVRAGWMIAGLCVGLLGLGAAFLPIAVNAMQPDRLSMAWTIPGVVIFIGAIFIMLLSPRK